MTKPIRVRDLREQTMHTEHTDAQGQKYILVRPVPFLHCIACGAEYSAHAGDYFAAAPDTIMTCCEEPMVLVKRESRLVEVST